jgi:membrane protein
MASVSPPAPPRLSPRLPEDAPAHHRALRTLVRLVEGLYYHDALSAAPAMAFHFFLSLIPLLVFVGYLAGTVARTQGTDAVIGPLLELLPTQAEGILKRELERLSGVGGTIAPVAFVGFVWTAAGGAHGFMDALEVTLSATRRPWWKKRVISIGWVFGATTGVILVTSLFAKLSAGALLPSQAYSREWMRQLIHTLSDRTTTSLAVAVVVGVCALAAFYWLSVERPKHVKRRVWPGALVAMVLWMSMSWGFGSYVSSLGTYTVYYGSLAAVAVLLVWFWLSSLVFLVGAELNAQLEGVRDHHHDSSAPT